MNYTEEGLELLAGFGSVVNDLMSVIGSSKVLRAIGVSGKRVIPSYEELMEYYSQPSELVKKGSAASLSSRERHLEKIRGEGKKEGSASVLRSREWHIKKIREGWVIPSFEQLREQVGFKGKADNVTMPAIGMFGVERYSSIRDQRFVVPADSFGLPRKG